MQSKTSVRQPVIAGARRQHLSELLRKWRRQPRKRSPLLFWTLLSLALMSDSGLLILAARLLGVEESASPAADFVWWDQLSWEGCLPESAPAGSALYSSVLAVIFFAAAAAMRLRRPRWRRWLLFAGFLSGSACLAWLLGPFIQGGLPTIDEDWMGLRWSACVMMGLGLVFGVLFRDAFLPLVGALISSIGIIAANYWPDTLAEVWAGLPIGDAKDASLRIQVLMLLSAYAALALAWSIAALTLVRILFDEPSSERLRRLTALCLWTIQLGLLLVAASALLDGWRGLDRGFAWSGWNAQLLGTRFALPGCAALVFFQRRGKMTPLRFLISVVIGLTFLAMIGMIGSRVVYQSNSDLLHLGAAQTVSYLAGLFSLSLAAHAALRYYFGKQRILER